MTSSGISTPVIVSSGEEDDGDDVPIYLHVRSHIRFKDLGFYWYVLKTRTHRHDFSAASCKKVSPLFKEEPFRRLYSGCVYLGGTLYLIGGWDFQAQPISSFPVRGLDPPSRDVFYIDTTTSNLGCPEEEQSRVHVSGGGGGWRKLDHSTNVPRVRPYAFAVDGKIYVMGGVSEKSPKPEVLDTSCMDDGWRVLQDSTDVPGYIDGHAVIDDGKRFLVQSRFDPHLYCYDVEADSWQVYLKHVTGLPPTSGPSFVHWESAFVDGILYYLDNDMPGSIFGVDVSRPRDSTAEPKMVRLPSGRKLEDWRWNWIPQPPPESSDLLLPQVHLVPLGSGKLGVLWSSYTKGELDVYCSTIKIYKEEKKHEESGNGDNFELVALPLSLSHVLVDGVYLDDWLAVYPCQRTGPNGDLNKDDNKISAIKDVDDVTLSANYRSSTSGSKKKKKEKGKLSRSGQDQRTGNVGPMTACGIIGVQE